MVRTCLLSSCSIYRIDYLPHRVRKVKYMTVGWWRGTTSYPCLSSATLPFLQCGDDAKREASRLWCFILGCFVKRVLPLLGWTLSVTVLLGLNLPSFLKALRVWDISLRLETLFPFSSLISQLPLFPQALFCSLQLSSPSLSPLVSLHISLGLAPLIKHSCRAHSKDSLFSHCYINWLAVFLRPWPCWFWVTSVTVVYGLDMELNLLSPLTQVS